MAAGLIVLVVVFATVSAVVSSAHGDKDLDKLIRRSGRRHITTSESTSADLDGFIDKWAADNKIEAYSVMAGDGEGTRYVKTKASSNPAAFNRADKITRPNEVYSVGKWMMAATLGFAMKHKSEAPGSWKAFDWDDPIHKFIGWWTKDPSDGRSKITFRHLLEHTSGLTADSHFAHAMGWQEMIYHADCGWRNSSIILKNAAKKAYQNTPPSINPPETWRYGETHYLVAQYAAQTAFFRTGRTWKRFLHWNFGRVLGLWKEVIRPHNKWFDGKYFNRDAGGRAYGFYEFDKDPKKKITFNPDMGSQLIIAPCGVARWLVQMAKQGEELFMADTLDKPRTDTGHFAVFGKYAMGHWVYDDVDPPVYHSLGSFGSTPIMSTLPNGKKFWIFLNLYEAENGLNKGAAFIKGAADAVRSHFSSSLPKVFTAGCGQMQIDGAPSYVEQFGPLSGGVLPPRHAVSLVEQERYWARATDKEEEIDELFGEFMDRHEYPEISEDMEEMEDMEDPSVALRAKLATMKTGALRRQAAGMGISEHDLEEADDAVNTKAALTELIVTNTASEKDPSSALRAELATMKTGAMRKMAARMGIQEHYLEKADDADNTKAALIELIVENNASEKETEHAGAHSKHTRTHAKRAEIVVNALGEEEEQEDRNEKETGTEFRDVIVDANGDSRIM